MQNSGNLVLAEDLNRYAITQVENSVVDLKTMTRGAFCMSLNGINFTVRIRPSCCALLRQ